MTTDTSTLQDFVNQGWRDHADDAQGVMDRFLAGIELVAEADDLPGLSALIVHVAAEHLGQLAEGLALLDRFAALPVYDPQTPSGKAVLRGQAVLHLCAGKAAECDERIAAAHDGELPLASTQVRVKAVAAAALAGQGRLAKAIATFEEAVSLADYGPSKEDPAARALAITGNNLACSLEEKTSRSAAEDELLELAAKTARTYWELAGTWVEVKIAEYRLAMTHLALGRPAQARIHAQQSLELCDANDGSDSDRFFPYEAMARACHADGDGEKATAARNAAAAVLRDVDDDAILWCAQALVKLDADLASTL